MSEFRAALQALVDAMDDYGRPLDSSPSHRADFRSCLRAAKALLARPEPKITDELTAMLQAEPKSKLDEWVNATPERKASFDEEYAKAAAAEKAHEEALANTPTPQAQHGTWTLIAPDGRQWQGDHPIKVVRAEMRERVPAEVGLARILREVRSAPAASDGERE